MKRQEAELHQTKGNVKPKTDVTHRGTSNGKGTDNNRSKAKKKVVDPVALERSQLVLWRSPFKTIYYFISEVPCSVSDAKNR